MINPLVHIILFFEPNAENVALLKNMIKQDPTLLNADNGEPIHTVLESKKIAFLEALIACGANVNIKSQMQGLTPIQKSIATGFFDGFMLLAKHGADLRVTLKLNDGTQCSLLDVLLVASNTDTFTQQQVSEMADILMRNNISILSSEVKTLSGLPLASIVSTMNKPIVFSKFQNSTRYPGMVFSDITESDKPPTENVRATSGKQTCSKSNQDSQPGVPAFTAGFLVNKKPPSKKPGK